MPNSRKYNSQKYKIMAKKAFKVIVQKIRGKMFRKALVQICIQSFIMKIHFEGYLQIKRLNVGLSFVMLCYAVGDIYKKYILWHSSLYFSSLSSLVSWVSILCIISLAVCFCPSVILETISKLASYCLLA